VATNSKVANLKDRGKPIIFTLVSTYKLLSNNKLKFFKHKLVSDEDAEELMRNARGVAQEYNDTQAHIISITDNNCAYKVGNEIYIIPAKPRAVVLEGKVMTFTLDYPCEMKREDLIEL